MITTGHGCLTAAADVEIAAANGRFGTGAGVLKTAADRPANFIDRVVDSAADGGVTRVFGLNRIAMTPGDWITLLKPPAMVELVELD